MSNPALELAAILREWRVIPQGTNIQKQRSGGDDGPRGLWPKQWHAARLLAEVDDALRALEADGRRVEHYRRAMGSWSTVIWAPDVPWGNGHNTPYPLVDETSIDLLESLGDLLAHTTPSTVIDDGPKSDSIDAIGEALDLLAGMPLTGPERMYAVELLTRTRSMLESASHEGSRDLLRAVYELRGFLDWLADLIDERPGPGGAGAKLRDLVRRIRPWAAPTSLFVMSAVQTAAAVKELTA